MGRFDFLASVVIAILLGHSRVGLSQTDVCDIRVVREVFREGTDADRALFSPAQARLERILRTSPEVKNAWNAIANDVIDLVDPLGVPPRVTIHDWIRLTLRDGSPGTPVTDDMIKTVILSVHRLRNSIGELHAGILRKTGVGDGSRRWLLVAAGGNRGDLFEVVAVRNLLDDGFIAPNRLFGLQVRHFGVEGDAVELLNFAPRRFRFIDVKAVDGNFSLDELDRVFDVLTDPASEIDEFVFAIEEGATIPSPWIEKFDQVSAELVAAGIPRTKLNLVSAGFFRP